MSASVNTTQQHILNGIRIAPGMASGQAFVYRDILQRDFEFYDIEDSQITEEHERIQQAVNVVREDLQLSADRVEEELDSQLANIFRAQYEILEDVRLADELLQELEQELVNAEQITRRVLWRWERKFREKENALLNQRADDIADLSRRLLYALQGIHAHRLESIPSGSVLVAKRLLPSDTTFLSRQSTVAVVVEFGGPGSHAALLTRALGIPAVGQILNIFDQIHTGDPLLVNGTNGQVIVAPNAQTRLEFEQRMTEYDHILVQAQKRCHEPAVTRDDVQIDVLANVTCCEDVELARKHGADGIGLYRTESIYLNRKILPSEDELFEQLHEAVAPLRDRPVTIRLLDAGGDKPLPTLNLPHEENPFLGRRGVRLLLDYPDLLTTQVAAILRLSQQFDVRLLIPMVTLANDIVHVQDALHRGAERLHIDTLPLLGTMIETPAAALCVESLRQHVDFFSIGTNDLTQYTMAAGRENPFVSDYFQDTHPAIFKLVRLVVEQAAGMPVSVCGELAGNLEWLTTLLIPGITALSVPTPLIPQIKDRIRTIRMSNPTA